MKMFLAFVLLLSKSSTLIKASPVVFEHSPSLVESQGTHVRGNLVGGGKYSLSSGESAALYDKQFEPQIKPLRQAKKVLLPENKAPRRPISKGIDTTLQPWIPPQKRRGETAKSYRRRFIKAQSYDRINREAKEVILKHFPDHQEASNVFVAFNKDERDRSHRHHEENKRLREVGVLKKIPRTEEEKAERVRAIDRERWNKYARKNRLRARILEAKRNGIPIKKKMLERANEIGLDINTIHQEARKGRRSEVKDRVHAFLLNNGLVTKEALQAAEGQREEVLSASPVIKTDFMDTVLRKPRTKKPKIDTVGGNPLTSSGDQDQQLKGPVSETSSLSGSPVPRRQRTPTFEVPKERLNESLVSSLPAHPQQTRTKVAKKRKWIKDTIENIFGDA